MATAEIQHIAPSGPEDEALLKELADSQVRELSSTRQDGDASLRRVEAETDSAASSSPSPAPAPAEAAEHGAPACTKPTGGCGDAAVAPRREPVDRVANLRMAALLALAVVLVIVLVVLGVATVNMLRR